MQAMVTVIITTVLQMPAGLQASLPARSITGPAFLQNIYSDFTRKIHSILWRACTPRPVVSLPRQRTLAPRYCRGELSH